MVSNIIILTTDDYRDASIASYTPSPFPLSVPIAVP